MLRTGAREISEHRLQTSNNFHFAFVVTALLTCAAAPSITRAQPTQASQANDAANRASARSLFEEGVGFAEAGKWGDAADRFQRSLALHQSQVVAFNYATALMELGRLVEASELLEGIRRDAATSPQMKRRVDTLLETLRPQLAWITVLLNHPENRVAVIDGHPLPQAALGVPRAVDPGKRTLEVRVDGEVVYSRTITVTPGETEEARIELPLEPATTQPTAPTPAETAARSQPAPNTAPIAPQAQDNSGSGPWLWVGIGGAAVVVAVVAIVIATSAGGSEPAPAFSGTLGTIEVPAQ